MRKFIAVTLLLCSQAFSATIFSDDFATGYSWGALPITSGGTISGNSAFAGNWQFIDYPTNNMAIDQCFWDNAKTCFRLRYQAAGGNEDGDIIQHKFVTDRSPSGLLTRPTEIWVQWKEYRSSGFDCGPSKDWRLQMYPATDYPNNPGGTGADLYGGFANQTVSGQQDCNSAGLNIQGDYASQTPRTGGDGNTIAVTLFNFTSGALHTVEMHWRANTPGTGNGIAEEWVDGSQIMSVTNAKFCPDSYVGCYIDFFQLGMASTNGNQAFVGTNYIWRTDLVISTSCIGTCSGTDTPINPAAASMAFTGATSTIVATGNVAIAPAAAALHFTPATSTITNSTPANGFIRNPARPVIRDIFGALKNFRDRIYAFFAQPILIYS